MTNEFHSGLGNKKILTTDMSNSGNLYAAVNFVQDTTTVFQLQ